MGKTTRKSPDSPFLSKLQSSAAFEIAAAKKSLLIDMRKPRRQRSSKYSENVIASIDRC
jgi:hypothetical protein